MHPMNVPATFKVRSLLALPVPELIGGAGGGQPLAKNWFSRWLCPRSLSPKNPKKSYAYRTDYLSLRTRFPATLHCIFEWRLRTLNLGKGEAVGGRRHGTVRKSVGEFL